ARRTGGILPGNPMTRVNLKIAKALGLPGVTRCHRLATSVVGTKRRFWNVLSTVASLIGRLGSSAFRLSTAAVLMSLRGLALLFGIGTKALPSWGSKTRWNNLTGG